MRLGHPSLPTTTSYPQSHEGGSIEGHDTLLLLLLLLGLSRLLLELSWHGAHVRLGHPSLPTTTSYPQSHEGGSIEGHDTPLLLLLLLLPSMLLLLLLWHGAHIMVGHPFSSSTTS